MNESHNDPPYRGRPHSPYAPPSPSHPRWWKRVAIVVGVTPFILAWFYTSYLVGERWGAMMFLTYFMGVPVVAGFLWFLAGWIRHGVYPASPFTKPAQ